MMWSYGNGWGGGIVMVLGMVLLLGILWFALSSIFRWGAPQDSHLVVMPPTALEILRQRYAHGEIDEATFERMRQNLTTPDASVPPR